MKLSESTEQEKIRALAEMDGWTFEYGFHWHPQFAYKSSDNHGSPMNVSNYFTSYDATIPLIQKQNVAIKMAICYELELDDYYHIFNRTPQQLSDALLIASGKFEL